MGRGEMTIRSWIAATFAVASLTLVFAGQSHATVFAAWQVADVPFGDTLTVRKYLSGREQPVVLCVGVNN